MGRGSFGWDSSNYFLVKSYCGSKFYCRGVTVNGTPVLLCRQTCIFIRSSSSSECRSHVSTQRDLSHSLPLYRNTVKDEGVTDDGDSVAYW